MPQSMQRSKDASGRVPKSKAQKLSEFFRKGNCTVNGGRRIERLSDHVINQIKAGEVVERPLSVVKELVENSVDAGATAIAVDLLDGGRQLIRITDDGGGINRADLPLALERHATSKLRDVADLDRIGTLGFRGEALPSIASVSRFTLRSNTGESPLGGQIEVIDGKISPLTDVPMPRGTVVEVRDLFGNVPARAKFMRKTATEFSHVYEFLKAIALAYPKVGWKLSHNGRESFSYRAAADLRERFAAVVGREMESFVEVRAERGSYVVRGFVGLPETARPLAQLFVTFVNGRFVRDKVFRSAVLQGYGGLLMKGMVPSVVLFLDLDPQWVDVNAHPAKTELRFHDPAMVQDFVAQAVQDSLREALNRATAALHKPAQQAPLPPPDAPNPFLPRPGAHPEKSMPPAMRSEPPSPVRSEPARFDKPAFRPEPPRPRNESARPLGDAPPARFDPPRSRTEPLWTPPRPSPRGEPAEPVSSREPLVPAREPSADPTLFDDTSAPSPLSSARYLGQYLGCYLLLEVGRELWVVDQHAFHERILFEEAARELDRGKGIAQQGLLVPVLVPLPPGLGGVVNDETKLFEELGFAVEVLQNGNAALHSLPVFLEVGRATAVFDEILARVFALADLAVVDAHPLLVRAREVRGEMLDMSEARSAGDMKKSAVYRPFLATMACHSAVRAGEVLADEQVRRLLARAGDVDFFAHCPHGRPVVRKFLERDVAAWFLRV